MSVEKNAIYKVHNGVDFDTINFKTIAAQVKFPDGTSLLDFIDNGGKLNGDLDLVNNGITSHLGYSGFTPVASGWSVKGGAITTPVGVNLAVQPGQWSALVPFKNGELNLGTPSYRYQDLYLVNPPNVSSKRELKENINIFDDVKAYEGIKNLNIYTYDFIGGNGEEMLGSIYDELPIECINEKGEGVDLYAYTSYAISALKEAVNKIETLEQKVKALESK